MKRLKTPIFAIVLVLLGLFGAVTLPNAAFAEGDTPVACTVTPELLDGQGRYTVTGLGRYTVTGLGRYIVTGLGRYTVTGLGRYTVTGLGELTPEEQAQLDQLADFILNNTVTPEWLSDDDVLDLIASGVQFNEDPVGILIVDDFDDDDNMIVHGELVDKVFLDLFEKLEVAGVDTSNIEVIGVDISDTSEPYRLDLVTDAIDDAVTQLYNEGTKKVVINMSFGLLPCEDPETGFDIDDFLEMRENPPAPQPGGITPILECVSPNNDGTYTAHFGYESENLEPVVIPEGWWNPGGTGNKLIRYDNEWNSEYLDPLTVFQPGTHNDELRVTFEKRAVWGVRGPDGVRNVARADADSPICEEVVKPVCEAIYYMDLPNDGSKGSLYTVDLNRNAGTATLNLLGDSPFELAHIGSRPDGSGVVAVNEKAPANTIQYAEYDVEADTWSGVTTIETEFNLGDVTQAAFAPNGLLWITSKTTDHLYTVNPNNDTVTDLGPIYIVDSESTVDINGADLVFAPDGTLYLATRSGGKLFVVTLEEGMLVGSPGGAPGQITGMMYLSDEDQLVFSDINDKIWLVNSNNANVDHKLDMVLDGEPFDATWGDMAGDCTVDPVEKVSPVFECYANNDDGTFTAFFGYNNSNEHSVYIPVGGANKFTGAPQDVGQPRSFSPGRQQYVFQWTADSGTNLVWTLNGKTATGSDGNPEQMCESNSSEAFNDFGIYEYFEAELGFTQEEALDEVTNLLTDPDYEDQMQDLRDLLAQYLDESCNQASCEPSSDRRIVAVASSGNFRDLVPSGTPLAPARFPETIASSASLNDYSPGGGNLWEFSHNGHIMTPGAWYEFNFPGMERFHGAGTSFSAPYTSTILALYLTYGPEACVFDGVNPPLVDPSDLSNPTFFDGPLACSPPDELPVEPGVCYATSVDEYTVGIRLNGKDVRSERTNPDNALGAPQDDDTTNFVSLGFDNPETETLEGVIVLNFGPNAILNREGDDFRIWETTFNDTNRPWSYYPESALVEAWDAENETWVVLGEVTDKDQSFDLGDLEATMRIRLTNTSNPEDFGGWADGFDVDAVEGFSCSTPPTY